MALLNSHREPNERYPVLRIVSVAFTAIGGVEVVLGTLLLVLGLYALASGTPAEPPPPGAPLPARATVVLPLYGGLGAGLAVLFSLGFLLSGLQLLAIGLLLRLAIHVEENTRATAQGLEKLCARGQSGAPADGAESMFVS